MKFETKSPLPLAEQWVKGEISDEEHIRRVKATLKQVLTKRGH